MFLSCSWFRPLNLVAHRVDQSRAFTTSRTTVAGVADVQSLLGNARGTCTVFDLRPWMLLRSHKVIPGAPRSPCTAARTGALTNRGLHGIQESVCHGGLLSPGMSRVLDAATYDACVCQSARFSQAFHRHWHLQWDCDTSCMQLQQMVCYCMIDEHMFMTSLHSHELSWPMHAADHVPMNAHMWMAGAQYNAG